IALLEIGRRSGQRAARTDRAHKGTHLAGSVLPNLRTGGAVVREAVGGVVELVRPKPALLRRKPPGDVVVVFRVGIRLLRGGDNLGPQRAEQVDFFSRLGFWNDGDGTVDTGVADDREPDAGIPSRAFDDGAAALQKSFALGVLDNAKRSAVLDRSARVHEFGFAEDFAAGQI